MKPKKLFNSETDHFFKKISKEFNFNAFSWLILIRSSIEAQLIAWYNKHDKNSEHEYIGTLRGLFRCLKIFFGKVVLLGVKEFDGLHDDLKIIWKKLTTGRYHVANFWQSKKYHCQFLDCLVPQIILCSENAAFIGYK